MISSSPWIRKPLWAVREQEDQEIHNSNSEMAANNIENNTSIIKPHLSLCDLVSVGVGGTIGSGIFVLCGSIAHNYAGPATFLSFAISGIASCFSGVCFAELAGKLPGSGSTYIYAYVSMGELAAVWAASCLTLEYAVAGAAVARSWGDKVTLWWMQKKSDNGFLLLRRTLSSLEVLEEEREESRPASWLASSSVITQNMNPMAIVVSGVSVLLLVNGVQESKRVSNFFTILKIILVIFLIIAGFGIFSTSNIIDDSSENNGNSFFPYGIAGVFRGATTSFFGYLGYDEVCCLAGEALVPHRDMPRAVLLTLCIVALLYILAAIALVGMQPYTEIDETSGFPMAFLANNKIWASQTAAAGEIVTLPVVVLISLLAQPRLFMAMARDGILPRVFLNYKFGTWISGIAMVLLSGFVPFQNLDDLISAGILVAFSMTNTSLILLRCRRRPINYSENNYLPQQQQRRQQQLLLDNDNDSLWLGLCIYHLLCFFTSLAITDNNKKIYYNFRWMLLFFMTLGLGAYLAQMYPSSSNNFNPSSSSNNDGSSIVYFEAPLVPFIPLTGIFINWYLIAQLEWTGLFLLLFYLGMTAFLYNYYSRIARFLRNDDNDGSNNPLISCNIPSWKKGRRQEEKEASEIHAVDIN